ncbi:hypothetical protein HYT51_02720 [Candidatus Woesearchaeota archaeon]|nr:hypothetical protein [Candidatus Woesearchaeota archaeon]
MNKNSIGIIGSNGFIGKILKKYYPQASGYDIQGECDELLEVLSKDIIFIAINLGDNCASSESKNILKEYLREIKKEALIIIKSTFIPGTTDLLQTDYGNLNFVYCPEFLTEMTAWEDFTKPQFQILGCPHQSLDIVHEIFSILPDAPIKRVVSPLDAEVLKHAINSYYATKLIFFNQLYDACQQLNSDYETVKEIMIQNPWIGNSHSVIHFKGYRGYGNIKVSKCIPKDSDAFRRITNIPLLDKVAEINEELWKKEKM